MAASFFYCFLKIKGPRQNVLPSRLRTLQAVAAWKDITLRTIGECTDAACCVRTAPAILPCGIFAVRAADAASSGCIEKYHPADRWEMYGRRLLRPHRASHLPCGIFAIRAADAASGVRTPSTRQPICRAGYLPCGLYCNSSPLMPNAARREKPMFSGM